VRLSSLAQEIDMNADRTLRSRAAGRPVSPGTARRQSGQGMTEYIIVVALIAVAAIGVYTLFGQTIRNQTAGLALEVSGQTASTAIGNAQTNATTASTNANVRKGLDNYDANNR
jgi:hypothetical protein